jgi:hypothetical protein
MKNNHKDLQIKLDSVNLSKKSLETILENVRVLKKRLETIENLISEAHRTQYAPSRDIPGEIGIFDGECMVTTSGIKYEVPKNYSAKSLLIIGDELKKYKEEGKEMFKIVKKTPRKKVKGTLSKKDGKYVILVDGGKSFFLLKSAVEFRNLKQGDEIIAVVPEKENSDYAAIDKLAPKISHSSQISHTSHQPSPKKEVVKETITQIQEKKEEPKKIEKIEFEDEDLL